jgi:hypothetical protein
MLRRDLLVVVEAPLARFVVAFAPRRTGVATPWRTGYLAATATIEAAAGRRATATTGEVGAFVAHRAAVATAATRAGAAISATAASAITTTASAATIATATATAVSTAAAAAAIGRTRTARTEATTIAAAAAAKATATTTGLAFNGFADRDRATIEQRAIHGLHGGSAHVICFHLEEGEAAAAAGLAIHDHF